MALRVLAQVNYSAGQNADGDSGLRFIESLLHALVARDADLHFYVLVPEKYAQVWTEALDHPRITPIPINLQPRLHGGDFQFDPVEIYKRFDFKRYDVDVLFLNQPETAPAFLQFFNRQTFHNIPALSYVHWFDTRRPSTPKQTAHFPALIATLTGMIVSTSVGCNSAYGREAILKQAARWFGAETVDQLRRRIKILPPAINASEFRPRMAKKRRRKVQIVINHRLLKYTGVRGLLTDVLPRLWTQRQDFIVVVTNPTRIRLPGTITSVPWLRLAMLPRPDYIRMLRESDIVIAPHRSTHWSMSTLEAICADCVALMNVESFFPEMIEPLVTSLSRADQARVRKDWFYFRANIVDRLSNLIDNIDEERELARLIGRRARRIYDSSAWVDAWIDMFRQAERGIPEMADRNPSMNKIVNLLRRDGIVSKELILRELKWAPKQRALSWTSFRKRLKSIAQDDSNRPDVIFKL
jgi:glycosyltransferase involved in cell wall biosynthesis